MSKRVLCVVFLLFLSGITPSVHAQESKAGSKCEKVGLTKVDKNVSYTCIKNGKRNVWKPKDNSKNTQKNVTAPEIISSTLTLSNQTDIGLIYTAVNICFKPSTPPIVDVYEYGISYLKDPNSDDLDFNSYSSLETFGLRVNNENRDTICVWERLENFTNYLKKIGVAPDTTFRVALRGSVLYSDSGEYTSEWTPSLRFTRKGLIKINEDLDKQKVILKNESSKQISSPAPIPITVSTPTPVITKKPIPTLSPSHKNLPLKLPRCTGSQEASLINLLSQYSANSRMIGIYRDRLEKVNNDLGNAYARNAMWDYEKLLVDKKSIDSELNTLYLRGDKLRQDEKIILATCIRQDQETDFVVPNNQKILPCTVDEVKRLLMLIAQYSTKQELIRINKSNIEKARIDLNYAVSAGKNPGNFQAAIQRYSRTLDSDLGAAALLKREFNALNSGCSNSKLFLP